MNGDSYVLPGSDGERRFCHGLVHDGADVDGKPGVTAAHPLRSVLAVDDDRACVAPSVPARRRYVLGAGPSDLSWLRSVLGAARMPGAFRRGGQVVYTAMVGEYGFIEPRHAINDHGPAVVAPLTALGLSTRINDRFEILKVTDRGLRPDWFPVGTCARALEIVDELPHLRPLRGVCHTPIARPDGGVLTDPGYDEASGYLFVPDVGVPPVPPRPSVSQVSDATALLRGMVDQFAWAGAHDEANFLGALLSPLLKLVAPPPYRLFALMARERGSGKSLLAKVLRHVHGGVLRSWPHDDAELAKTLTSVLTVTTAPIVQFDNLRGVINSARLEGLLTTATYTDRVLGSTNCTDMVNDRLWVITGNNVTLGGDLARRTLWCAIDPGVPHPETRTGFRLDLPRYTREHRGEILHALLTWIAAWDADGRPTGAPSADDYGRWIEVVRAVLATAGVPGTFAHPDSEHTVGNPDEVEWAELLRVIHDQLGDQPWSARDLAERMAQPGLLDGGPGDHLVAALPTALHEKFQKGSSPRAITKSLGRWLHNREGQWFDRLTVRKAGHTGRDKITLWVVTESV